MASTYLRESLERFEQKILSLDMPLGGIEGKIYKILQNMKSLSNAGSRILIDAKGSGCFDCFGDVELSGDMLKIIKYDLPEIKTACSYFLLKPKSMIVHHEPDLILNYVMLLTEQTRPYFDSAANPELLLEKNGNIFSCEDSAQYGGECNSVINIHKEDALLFYPRGSVYTEDSIREKLFSRFEFKKEI